VKFRVPGGLGKSALRRIALAALLAVITTGSLILAPVAEAATAPGPPTGVTAVAGNAQATVSWKAPASNGGSAVTGYTVTSIPGGQTAAASGSATSAVVTGLTNGASYRFTVTAASAAGTSVPSASSDAVTPSAPAVPSAPVITNVSARAAAVEVSWSPPDTGSASLTGYTITAYSGTTKVTTASESASMTDAIVTGLTNGTDYTFTVTAANSTGSSPPSGASAPVAPRPATAPMAPADVQAVPQAGQIQVAWTAPPDGGSAITGYTVSVSPATVAPITIAAGTTVATVTGLTNGTSYKMSVTATNVAGTSPVAAASAVTPAASIVPGGPGSLSAVTTAAGAVELEWVPPTSPGTSAISSYKATDKTGSTSVSKTFPVSDCTGTPVLCQASWTGLTKTASYTFTVAAVSAAGTGAASTATNPVIPNIVVLQAPVVLSSASAAALRTIGNDGTLYFERPPSQVTGLQPNDLVRISPDATVPNGFLGKVVQVSTQAGLVVVTTSGATLADEYSSYGASLSIPINSASMTTMSALPGVKIERPSLQGRQLGARAASANPDASAGAGLTWTGQSLVLSVDTDLIDGDSPQGEDTPKVVSGPIAHLQGDVTLTPQLSGSVNLPDVSISVSSKISADLSGQFGVQLGATKTIQLAQIGDAAIDTPIGPQDLTFSIDAIINSNGSVGISFESGFQQTLGTTCTIDVITPSASEDNCTGSHAATGSIDAKSNFYGSMDITAGVQLAITWQIEDLAGPSISLEPYLEATEDTTANPWQDISIGADVGIAVQALHDCLWEWCLPGVTLYQDPNLINEPLVDIWNSGDAFSGLVISPNVTEIGPNQSVTLTATATTGVVSSSAAWTKLSGPGAISSTGTFTAAGDGITVIEADYDGLTARAGIITGSALQGPQVDQRGAPHASRGLVDSALTSWEPPGTGSVDPAYYTVTAEAQWPLPPGSPFSSGESDSVPYPETYAYLPNLAPGVGYTVTVSAVGANGNAVAAQAMSLVPLAPLPGVLAGTGDLTDVTNIGPGIFDKTGSAGFEQAAISGDGRYAFYFVEARSPLAPASVWDPASTDWYLVRKSLSAPDTIQLASYGTDGNPVPVNAPAYGDTVTVNENGSAVAYDPGTPGLQITGDTYVEDEDVHDFTTNTTWQIAPPSGYGLTMAGLALNGTAAFSAIQETYDQPMSHVYLQPMNGAAQQIDGCTNSLSDFDSGCGEDASMSSDGSEVAYNGSGGSNEVQTVYLYSSSMGSSKELFAANNQNGDWLYDPVLSGDGTHIALNYEPGGSTDDGIVIVSTGASSVTASNIIAPYDEVSTYNAPVSLNSSGSVLAYEADNYDQVTADGGFQAAFKVYRGGSTLTAPASADMNASCIGGADTADLTADGAELLYTECLPGENFDGGYDNFPGVYEWQLP